MSSLAEHKIRRMAVIRSPASSSRAQDVLPAIDRGVSIMGERLGAEVQCEEGVREHIASACGGDVRKAMNAIELLLTAARREQGKLLVTLEDAKTAAQKSAMRYDPS